MKKPKDKMKTTKSLQKNKLERLFLELKLDYTKVNVSEDEFFYVVNLNSTFDEFGQIYVLISLSVDNKELLVMCPNIYILKENDSILSVLSALNNANSKLTGGTVTLDDDGTVMYRRVEYFDRVDSITKIKLCNIFNDIFASIIYTAQEIKNIRKNDYE